jgi:hypothetical protein
MAQPLEVRSIDQKKQAQVAMKRAVKKGYIPPTLVEYGSIAKLTQGGTVTGVDFARRMACL